MCLGTSLYDVETSLYFVQTSLCAVQTAFFIYLRYIDCSLHSYSTFDMRTFYFIMDNCRFVVWTYRFFADGM